MDFSNDLRYTFSGKVSRNHGFIIRNETREIKGGIIGDKISQFVRPQIKSNFYRTELEITAEHLMSRTTIDRFISNTLAVLWLIFENDTHTQRKCKYSSLRAYQRENEDRMLTSGDVNGSDLPSCNQVLPLMGLAKSDKFNCITHLRASSKF